MDPSVQPVQQPPAPVYQPYPTYQQAPPPPPAKPHRPIYKDRVVIGAIALIVILVSAIVIAAFIIIPTNPWSFNKTLSDQSPDAKTLNLNFHTNVGKVNVMTLKISDRNVLVSVQANGTDSAVGGSNDPVTFTFDNQTVDGVLTVNSEVNVDTSATSQSNVMIQIFVDPALTLNINVTSATGKVSFVADKATTLQGLNLVSTTGEAETSLQDNVTVTGDISLKSSTSDVNFRLSENSIVGNRTIDLHSSTGSVILDLTQTKTFNGNLHVNAATTTGSVSTSLTIDGAVAAKIVSQNGTSSKIQTNLNNFSGNDTALQSPNYPSACNIEVNSSLVTGTIYIDANYETTLISS